jgi:hypothetical protein
VSAIVAMGIEEGSVFFQMTAKLMAQALRKGEAYKGEDDKSVKANACKGTACKGNAS